MTELDDFTPENAEKPPGSLQMVLDDDTDAAPDAETEARNYLASLNGETEVKIFINKLAVGGNLAKEFANPCKITGYCDTYDFTKGEDLENLYKFVQENYEGGKYKFQIRIGQRNGKGWTKKLNDLPDTKPKQRNIESEDDAEHEQHNFSLTPREPEQKKDALDELIEQKTKIDKIQKLFAPQPQAPTSIETTIQKTRDEVLLEHYRLEQDAKLRERFLNAVLPDRTNDEDKSSFGIRDVLDYGIENKDSIVGFIGQIFALFSPRPTANSQPNKLLLNPPASLNAPQPATLSTEQKPATTTHDTSGQNVSPVVASVRVPRKPRPETTEETETSENA
jgi:hypothetical protein